MAFNTTDLQTRVTDHLLTLGVFDKVNGHEPKSAPGKGFTAAVWIQEIAPIQSSGLAIGSGRIEFNVRIYTNMFSDPPDAIDPDMAHCVDACFDSYSGDFLLDRTGILDDLRIIGEGSILNEIRCVDLLGAYGTPLRAVAGYITLDGKTYRVMTITLPVIVNDIWQQVA